MILVSMAYPVTVRDIEETTIIFDEPSAKAGVIGELGDILGESYEVADAMVIEASETPVGAPNSPFETLSIYETYKELGYTDDRFYDDLELLALICLAEAENQSELGKRLVIDTVLNRMDSEKWGDDTIADVVYHPGQYESVWNGRLERVELNDDVCRLVEEELTNRTNYEVIFFNTGGFAYSTAIMQEGDHFFCGQI